MAHRVRCASQIIRCTALALCGMGLPWQSSAMDLTQTWTQARQQDATYRAAMYGVQATREAMPQAVSQLLPNMSFSGSNNKINLNKTENGVTQAPFGYNSANSTLTIRQTLFRKNQFAQFEQAQAQWVGSVADESRAEIELLTRITGFYFETLYSEDVVAATQKLLEATQGQLKAAQRFFDKGQGTRTDVDEVQARLDQVIAQSLQVKQQLLYNKHQLESALNTPVDHLARLDAAQFTVQAPAFDLQHFMDLADVENPDLALAKAKVEVARLEVVKAESGHLPTVDWVAQKSLSKSENLINPLATYLTYQTGIQVNVPLFSGGYTQSTVRQSQAYLDRERENLEQARRTLALQVRKEYQNITEGLLKVRALEQALRSAQQLVVSSQKSIQAGVRTQTDLLNALQREAEAKRDLWQARYQFLMAQQKLAVLTGATPLSATEDINRLLLSDAKPVMAQSN